MVPVELYYFIEVAQTLNLSRAAERLGIAQPSLSTAMQRLEKSMGIELLSRHKKGVLLTPAGKQLLSDSKELLQLWEGIKNKAQASILEVQGTISIGCHPTLAIHNTKKFLPSLLEQFEKLNIHLKHDISRKIVEQVINFNIDIGIVVDPIRHPDLIIHHLYYDETSFWVNQEQFNCDYVNHEHKILICDPELTKTQILIKKAQKLGFRFSRLLTSSNFQVIQSLVTHGCGIGLLPKTSALQSHNPLIQLKNLPTFREQACLIYRYESKKIKAIQTIVKAIKQNIA